MIARKINLEITIFDALGNNWTCIRRFAMKRQKNNDNIFM